MTDGLIYVRSEAEESVLRDLIQILQSELDCVVQSRIEDIAFEEFPKDNSITLWPEGRAFGLAVEIRWQQTEKGLYNLMLLSEVQRELGEDWSRQQFQVHDQGPDGKPLRIYLWGTWQPKMNAWIEVRIPRILPYPKIPSDISKRHRIYVMAVEYTQKGIVRFIRWKKLDMEPIR
jgi:hypothetical protein